MAGIHRHIVLFIISTISNLLTAQTLPWTMPALSANSASLIINCIPLVDGRTAREGDYIGVFNESGKCFGLARWKDTADFRITVYGKDGVIDGFTTGERFKFRIWLHDENCAINLVTAVESDNPLIYSNAASNRVNVLNFVRTAITYPKADYCLNDAVMKPAFNNPTDKLTFSSGEGLAINDSTGFVNPADSRAGQYIINITSSACLSQNDISLTLNEVPDLISYPDTFICGPSLILSAPAGYNSVIWSTGEQTNQVRLTQPSMVWYRVTNQKGCSNADTFNVDKTSLVSVDYQIEPSDCYRKGSLRIDGNVISNGSPPYSYRLTNRINNMVYTDMKTVPEGIYDLDVINYNGCVLRYNQSLIVQDECLEDTPVFSPNEDGMDDQFFIVFEGAVRIYDKNGILKRGLTGPVYFDGLDESGRPLPMGTYLVVSGKGETLTLTVIR